MKKISLLIFLCASIFAANAQTSVSGGIFANTSWTLANSPYIVTGPVVVFPGVTLTIEPGVVVKVREISTVLGAQAYIEVRGKLVAKGNQANKISFVPETTPTPGLTYTWEGIKVKKAQGASIEMDYFVLENSYYGINYDEARYDTLKFNQCVFRKNNYAFTINANLEFDGCEFFENGVGVGGMLVYGTVTAKNSLFKDNYACLTFITGGITAENSRFENNEVCFTMSPGVFYKCDFTSNVNVFRETGRLIMDSCRFTNNVMGIEGFSYGEVKNSVFRGNQTALIVGTDAVVKNNEIENNGVGLAISGVLRTGIVLPFVKDNRICFNFNYNVENLSDFNVGLEDNCFCSSDSAAIDAKIYDGYDDFRRGLINFAVYDSACVTQLQKVIKVNLALGTELSNYDKVELYPNPFTTEISIRNFDGADEMWIVNDLAGRVVAEISVSQSTTQINMDFLQPGVYILRNSQGTFFKKIAKQ